MKRTLELFRELENIERDIAKTKLTRQSDEDIAEFEQRLAAFAFYADGNTITQDDKKRLFVLFHQYVEKQYFLGQQDSDDQMGVIKPVTKTDLQKIDRQAKDAMDGFLKALRDRGVLRDPYANMMAHYDIEQLSRTHADFDDVIVRAALQKKRQKKEAIFGVDWLNVLLLLDRPQVGLSVTITASDTGIRALNAGIMSNARRVLYQTRKDTRVCPRCEPFDGETYPVNENTGIVIGGPLIPQHPNCRCQYVAI